VFAWNLLFSPYLLYHFYHTGEVRAAGSGSRMGNSKDPSLIRDRLACCPRGCGDLFSPTEEKKEEVRVASLPAFAGRKVCNLTLLFEIGAIFIRISPLTVGEKGFFF
jgi:hypothetical protein